MHDTTVTECGWDGGFIVRCETCGHQHLGHYSTSEAADAVAWDHRNQLAGLPS